MNTHRHLTRIAAGTALALGLAVHAQAATFAYNGSEYIAPGGFSATFLSAGGDTGTLLFDIVTAGSYAIELTPSPEFTTSDWTAAVTGFGSLVAGVTTINGIFDFAVGNDYALVISSPDGASNSGYSVSGVMAAVPVPGTFGLLGLGLVGLGLVRRRAT